MHKGTWLVITCGAWVLASGFVAAQDKTPMDAAPVAARALEQMREALPAVRVHQEGGQITRIYGQPVSFGATPEASADAFVARYAEVLGVTDNELAPAGGLRGESPAQPVLYDRQTDTYTFTLVRYAQHRGGVPVFRADLRLLVRNETDYPTVLAASSVRSLGDFQPDLAKAVFRTDRAEAAFGTQARFDAAGRELPSFPGEPIATSEPELVIWAGVNRVERARLAYTFAAQNNRTDAGHEAWLFVTDAETGEVIYQEDLIRFVDVSGNVQAMATEGAKTAECSPEVLVPYPWTRADIQGAASVYADGNGDFTIPYVGSSTVTVRSFVDGLYFVVDNRAGAEETLSQSVTPPGPADFIHNLANNNEQVRAQVNAYVSANGVRDWVLAQNPSFPGIATETGSLIVVNRTDLYCPGNAWSSTDGSINFCLSGGGYPNTAWQSVVNHEYGHHVIDQTGSGQGQYGEGMGDCFSMIPVDDPVLGYGFFGDCNSGLRNADNNLQYPCTGEIHDCGQLLSGAVWSTRNELVVTEPTDYIDILSSLAVNSTLLHSGELITPQIAIDFLTLDDNDGNIDNGTPHRNEICAGFGAHNLDCPPLATGLTASPGSGFVAEGPGGGPFTPPSMNYMVQNLGPGAISYSVTTPATWLTISNGSGSLPSAGSSAVVTVALNASAASLPEGRYAATLSFVNTTDHVGDTTRPVTLTVGIPVVVYEWNMNSNPGWTVQGQWAWGQPSGGGGAYGNPDPTSGHTGTNVYGYNLGGDYTNSLPETHLTTTAIDCTGISAVTLKFWRWLGVERSTYDHAYLRVSTNGTNWTTIWQNSDVDVTDAFWVQQGFDISAIADNQPAVYLRWTMGPTDGGWTYCGWNIDDVQIVAVGGEEPPLSILFPTGVPAYLNPGVPRTFVVQIVDGSETYVPGSGLLYYRYDGGVFQTVPLVYDAGNLYLATLPAANCGDTPRFYVSAQGNGGSTIIEPPDSPGGAFAAQVGTYSIILDDNFEDDLGWTTASAASSGAWQRGVPVNDPGWDYDPASDADGSGKCWLTQNQTGNTDVDSGYVQLTSSTLDLSSGGITIEYDYYLRLTDTAGGVDRMLVTINNNGGTGSWTEIARHDTDGGLSWRHHVITQADLDAAGVVLTPNMQVRFEVNDANPQSIVEGGLDAFQVTGFACVPSGTCSDGIQNQGEDRIDCGGPCAPCDCTADAACDDALFCSGAETCDAHGQCVPGTPPCPAGQNCHEPDQACYPYGDGDFEPDGDVDLADFAAFQACFGSDPVDSACAAGDLNADNAVDMADVPAFLADLEAAGPQ